MVTKKKKINRFPNYDSEIEFNKWLQERHKNEKPFYRPTFEAEHSAMLKAEPLKNYIGYLKCGYSPRVSMTKAKQGTRWIFNSGKEFRKFAIENGVKAGDSMAYQEINEFKLKMKIYYELQKKYLCYPLTKKEIN